MADKLAVIKTGGKQYKVREGNKLKIEKFAKKEGDRVVFGDVLLYTDGKSVSVGAPRVAGVKVSAKILQQSRAPKVIAYKYKKRKRYSKTKGHRQPYTLVEILKIDKDS
jgi:large subunit ribosomal protein L21